MRNLVILLVLALGNGLAQSGPNMPVDLGPIGVVYLLNSSDQSFKVLPDESWKAVHSSTFKAAYGSKHLLTMSLEVSGARSPFRIASGKAGFVFTFDSPENAALYASSDSKDKRQFPVETVAIGDNKITPLSGIPVDLTQFGKSSYKMVPKSPLASGEYVIILRGSTQMKEHKAFTFGVD
jgi:hypothetical protein